MDRVDVKCPRPISPASPTPSLPAATPGYTRRWRRHLAAGFAVTLGDEVQWLLADAAPLWEIAHQLRRDFAEVDWVVACGRGALATRIPRGATAPELDR